MLDDELRTILIDLAATVGAATVEIAREEAAAPAAQAGQRRRTLALGAGATLVVQLAGPPDSETDAAIERAGRAIRAATRRWQAEVAPPMQSGAPPAHATKVVDRMRVFLEALCGSTGADAAAVVRHGKLVASAGPLTPLQEDRLPFTVKLVEAEALKQTNSSHAFLFGDDYYATTFYYGAALIGFSSRPIAPDFVRHHVKRVCRELSHMLALLDEEPPDPAHVIPT